jgi:hypothetical protein
MVRTYLKKRNEPDLPEAVRAVQERRLSLRVAASKHGMTHTALHYRNLKKEMVTSPIGPVCLLRVTQFGSCTYKPGVDVSGLRH